MNPDRDDAARDEFHCAHDELWVYLRKADPQTVPMRVREQVEQFVRLEREIELSVENGPLDDYSPELREIVLRIKAAMGRMDRTGQ